VVPAVAGLKKQGANNGACLAFLISTPESGVDSIALTYSLLDPIMTIIRPITAFVTAFVAGTVENATGDSYERTGRTIPDRTCLVDACCDGTDCDPVTHANHHTSLEKLRAGMAFAFTELMDDLALWFVLGIFLAGAITALIPQSFVSGALGSGIWAYLGMLVVSLPMYVCATLSTPVAAALIVKGLSPGAALVLLMAGPATNMATITMAGAMLGRRTLAIYLGSIVVCTLVLAYVTDAVYASFGLSAQASVGKAGAELIPEWLQIAAAILLGVLVLAAYWRKVASLRLFDRIMAGARKKMQVHSHSDCCHSLKSGHT
jgi:uncharacterized membrane protein YraQ (UPF0718 family)